MGVLNVTPDSFSDGGEALDPDEALEKALRMEEEGADLIDVGAESTRPGAKAVPAKEEASRLIPVLRKLISRVKIPFSVDTRKASVARRAVDAGAALVNDVSGFQFDPEMVAFLASWEGPAVLMHSRGDPKTMGTLTHYESLSDELQLFFDSKLQKLQEEGVSPDRLLLDPGIGFAKEGDQNLKILSQLPRFKRFGRPLVVGVSRKSFLEPYFGPTKHPRERALGTEVAHTLAILNGANILRVHDVKAAKRTIGFVKNFM